MNTYLPLHRPPSFYWLIIVLLIGLFSCEEELELPIEEDKLIPMMVDIHIAEVALQQMGQGVRDSMTNMYLGQIFEMHGSNKEDYRKTIDLVRREPELLQRIYAEVYRIIEGMEEVEQK